uniref:Induced myeloid leukemia cell differentiation protein Mcl-1 homolog n=1 Tax=Petromyzon marinus TaxID=7757 RepID=A0AAJ7SL10_PETMA|nr:induced myeloid leukemia cell differentiation protein Mcl-1 homolog [Petromyzon marinus]
MHRFKQLQLTQHEQFEQLRQFKNWQELWRQVQQLRRQAQEVQSELQASQRLVRQRVEQLQEVLDTQGDILLAQLEASIPDLASRTEELAREAEPLRLVVTMAWKVLAGGPMNWEGVLSMVVFCALLVKSLRASGRLGDLEKSWPLTDAVAAVLLITRKPWLMEQGGWEGFLGAFGPGTPTYERSRRRRAPTGSDSSPRAPLRHVTARQPPSNVVRPRAGGSTGVSCPNASPAGPRRTPLAVPPR